jgi:hypothetical protein
VGYEPAAVISHRHRVSYPELRAQMISYGQGFTAMLTALIASDRGHLAGLAAQLPVALRSGARATLHRAAGHPPPPRLGPVASEAGGRAFPRELTLLEAWGYLRGPFSYRAARRANALERVPRG